MRTGVRAVESLTAVVGAALALFGAVLVLTGCSGSDSASVEDEIVEEEEPHPLEGAWTTTGTDARYGDATVRMQMEADGELVVTVSLAAGGTLRFTGAWETEGQQLLLTGVYFEPAGQAQVIWATEGDSVMVLEADDGDQQRWSRERIGGS